MEEKDMREILERLDKSNRQQVRYARLQSILAVLAALCFIGLVVVVGSIVPELMDFASEAESLLGQAEVVLTNLEDVTNELAQVEFTKMIDDVNGLVTSSQQGLEGTLEKVNSIDIETLNEAIDGLAKVVEPLAKFFKVFG
jgi:predicted PurR-regulated permease PerM